MLTEESNPYTKPPTYAARINLCTVWDWWRDKGRAKLRESLQRSRERYRKAMRYKEKPITEAELYDMPPCGRREGCASCPDRDRCALIS